MVKVKKGEVTSSEQSEYLSGISGDLRKFQEASWNLANGRRGKTNVDGYKKIVRDMGSCISMGFSQPETTMDSVCALESFGKARKKLPEADLKIVEYSLGALIKDALPQIGKRLGEMDKKEDSERLLTQVIQVLSYSGDFNNVTNSVYEFALHAVKRFGVDGREERVKKIAEIVSEDALDTKTASVDYSHLLKMAEYFFALGRTDLKDLVNIF